LGRVSGTIFNDANSDGIMNPVDGDFPLAGILIAMTNSSGAVIGESTTNANGKYSFAFLPIDATYTVSVDTSTLPDNWSTEPSADPDGGADSVSEVTLTADAPDNLAQDFGYYPSYEPTIDLIKTAGDAADGETYTISAPEEVLFTYQVVGWSISAIRCCRLYRANLCSWRCRKRG